MHNHGKTNSAAHTTHKYTQMPCTCVGCCTTPAATLLYGPWGWAKQCVSPSPLLSMHQNQPPLLSVPPSAWPCLALLLLQMLNAGSKQTKCPHADALLMQMPHGCCRRPHRQVQAAGQLLRLA